MSSRQLDVYVTIGKKRPVKVAEMAADACIPSTMSHGGQTFYFASADLVEGWVTFSSVPPTWN